MKVLIWGMGYVGTTAAACLAKLGHSVVGVETHPMKLKALKIGNTFMKEPELAELLKKAVNDGLFEAVQDGIDLIPESDISLVCVGTPSAPDGSPNLDFIRRVAAAIGAGIKISSKYHVVALRCTVPPGTARNLLANIIEEVSGKKLGIDFGLVSNPEFLREGTSVSDFFNPPYTLIGGFDKRSSDSVSKLYESIAAPIHYMKIEEAELIKMVNNAFHALKISFANEVGRLAQRLDINGATIMDFVCKDKKLNISTAYLKPGFAFGGSCLPKDLRSITYQGRHHGIELPVLESIIKSNELHIQEALTKIFQTNAKVVTILGLSFKSDTDDMRESPAVELVHRLWKDGIRVSVYDPDVTLATLAGANLEYAKRQLPQLDQLLCNTLDQSILNSELVVITKNHPYFDGYVNSASRSIRVLNLVSGADLAYGSKGINKKAA